MYRAFDKFLAVPTWHTNHDADGGPGTDKSPGTAGPPDQGVPTTTGATTGAGGSVPIEILPRRPRPGGVWV
jgi:hypothetical protein